MRKVLFILSVTLFLFTACSSHKKDLSDKSRSETTSANTDLSKRYSQMGDLVNKYKKTPDALINPEGEVANTFFDTSKKYLEDLDLNNETFGAFFGGGKKNLNELSQKETSSLGFLAYSIQKKIEDQGIKDGSKSSRKSRTLSNRFMLATGLACAILWLGVVIMGIVKGYNSKFSKGISLTLEDDKKSRIFAGIAFAIAAVFFILSLFL